jgi:hypothetical protein
MQVFLRWAVALLLALPAVPQTAKLRPAYDVSIPFRVDGNSPSLWIDGRFFFFTSDAQPLVSNGEHQFALAAPAPIVIDVQDHVPMWIESVWRDDDGTIYGWYHNEPGGICPGGKLTAPRIGAVKSTDNGYTFKDLGLVLNSGDPVDCNSSNGFFGGGHGDFSVILDRSREYFYFFFTNYGGPAAGQGVVTARMSFLDRDNPAGSVFKYHNGQWSEPGLGGRVSAVFRARSVWQRADYDSFWGPAIHWNTHLERYVIVMNHACCGYEWPQEGIYITFNADLGEPIGWTTPSQLLRTVPWRPGFYPQVIGSGPEETDTTVGQVGRFYLHGRSQWEIVFQRSDEFEPDPAPEPGAPSGADQRLEPEVP